MNDSHCLMCQCGSSVFTTMGLNYTDDGDFTVHTPCFHFGVIQAIFKTNMEKVILVGGSWFLTKVAIRQRK